MIIYFYIDLIKVTYCAQFPVRKKLGSVKSPLLDVVIASFFICIRVLQTNAIVLGFTIFPPYLGAFV